ncbi:MAG: PhoU domain-containing protein [bacterium]
MWLKLINAWKSDNLLEQAWRQSYEMLDITHEMFLEAVRVLRQSDSTIIKKEIRNKDKIVNRYQQEVRRKVMTHCALQGPNELPGGLVLVSIVIDIERIGDYTKNIVELAAIHPNRLKGGLFEENLQRVEKAVKDNFIRTKECIESSDPSVALKLLKEYAWVSSECDERSFEIILEKDKNIRPGDAATLVLYFRWLKRVNSHLRNITTSVVNPFDRIGFKPTEPSEDI